MPSNRYTIVLAILSAAVCLTAGTAAASSGDATVNNSSGYIVVPAKNTAFNFGIMSLTNNIIQGQTNWHYKYVTSYSTYLNVDLDWGSAANSLKLTVYDPNQAPVGPFYDGIDGSIDGRINVNIINYNGIPQGTWSCAVNGYSVSGMESYTI